MSADVFHLWRAGNGVNALCGWEPEEGESAPAIEVGRYFAGEHHRNELLRGI